MRILVTSPDPARPGGVAAYITALQKHLPRCIDWFTVGRRASDQSLFRAGVRLLSDVHAFEKRLRTIPYSLVHLNPSLRPHAIIRDGILLNMARRAGVPTVVFFHGWNPDTAAALCGWKLRLFQRTYLQNNILIVLSKGVEADLRAWGCEVPVIVETTAFDDACLAGFSIEEKYARPPMGASVNLLFLNRIEKAKGVYEALDAYRILKEKHPFVRLTMAGDGSELTAVRSYAEAHKVKDIDFTGWVEGTRKTAVLREADCFLLPSYTEGMPLSVLEAMAYGLPIAATAVGGLKDFFEDNRMGAIISRPDAGLLAQRLKPLVVDWGLRKRIGAYNHAYAVERFAASRAATRLLGFYRDVVAAEHKNHGA